MLLCYKINIYTYFREVFGLYINGFFFVGLGVVYVGELFSVLRGYREITVTVNFKLEIRGSVQHTIIHIKNPTRCKSVSKVYFIFIGSSACFR